MRIPTWLSAGALLGALAACDGQSERENEMGAAGSSGASTGGEATGGSATAGSSSAGAVGVGSCSGAFGRAIPVLVEDYGYEMNGISLTGDELELYYSRVQRDAPSYAPTVVRRRRGSRNEPFSAVEALPELVNVCEPNQRVNPDVTDDGLALYVTCTRVVDFGMSEGVSQLRVARRPDRSSAFALQAEPVGEVFASAGIGPDELTAYTDGEVFDTAPRLFERATSTESFGEPQPVPGVDAPLNSPDVSQDGLALFGSANPASGAGNAIFRAVRSDVNSSFQPPAQLDLQLSEPAVGAPNITPSCTLYLIVVPLTVGYMVYSAALQ